MKMFVGYGGGTNSVAMLVGLLERGERPDAIVFADTGGEKPNTYAHIEEMQAWCKRVGFPEITILRGEQPRQVADGTLENECLRLGALPSKAMGFGACSQKWKVDPQSKWLRRMNLQEKPLKCIGFDVDEPQRAQRFAAEDKYTRYRFPLMEWDWGRAECVEAIKRAGISQPGKSACFFCPSSKKKEILELRDKYPDLLRRALEIERRAINGEGQAPALHTTKGLGRSFAWRDFIANPKGESLQDAFDFGQPEIDCGCYDGEAP